MHNVLFISRVAEGGVAIVLEHICKNINSLKFTPLIVFETQRNSVIRNRISTSNVKIINVGLGAKKVPKLSQIKNTTKERNYGEKINETLGSFAGYIYLSIKSLYKFIRYDIYKCQRYIKIIKNNNVKLIHSHSDLQHSKPEILAGFLCRVPCIIHVHGENYLSFTELLFSMLVKKYIYISKYIASKHRAQGIRKEKGVIIHNGIDKRGFFTVERKNKFRREFSCGKNEILIGILGRITWWKGHEIFIRALANVVKSFPQVKGIIVGNCTPARGFRNINEKYYEKLENMVHNLGLNDSIIFTGFRNDVDVVLTGLDIVVHASTLPEPFGLVVIEGMAAGKIVIATAAGGVLDIIENKKTGILIKSGDPKSLEKAITWILQNKEEVKRIALAGQRFVLDNFTVKQQISKIEKIYEIILSETKDN